MTPPRRPSGSPTSKDPILLLLRDLCAEGLLSDAQVAWLTDHLPDFADSWVHHPLFGEIREHTRLYLERLFEE